MEYKNQAEVLKTSCFRNRVNIIMPTLFQLKFFTSWGTTSQWPETDLNLPIRHKNIISNMLVLFPVINDNKWYVNCLCHFFPFAQWTQWRTVMIHRLYFHNYYLVKTGRSVDVVFMSLQIFFASSCEKFHIKNRTNSSVPKRTTIFLHFFSTFLHFHYFPISHDTRHLILINFSHCDRNYS
jgi:hypothetical protein